MHGDWQRNDALYAYFRKAIVADPDANLKAIPRKQRAVVRKAIDGGLDVDVGHDVDRFYRAFAESYRNLGTPILPKRYYARILETFGDRCEVVTVSHKGQLLSSVMVFLHRDQVMPYYGGGVPAARGTGANDLMYWVTMARAGERGFRIFDFGRSKRGTGSFEFKRHWGFEPEPMVYEYKLINGKSLPDLNPQNPKFARFIAAWQRLPLWVANRLGPLIARELA
jgi:FemAB-related protein (PEP-CTERM system-associated)